MRKMRQIIFIGLMASLLGGSSLSAQISITDSDILGLIGQTQLVDIDTIGGVAINLGSAGANQTWDLSNVMVDGIQLEVLFQTPAGTPFSASFPTANMVRSTTDSSGQDGFGVVNLFEYISVGSSEFETIGSAVQVVDLDTSFLEFNSNDVAPLPLSFNTTWTNLSADTVGDIATFANVSYDTTDNTVDGWGTVILPIGSFECLRVRADSRFKDESYVGGQVISSFSGSSISYSWVSKDNFILAEAESEENDTNPNFTMAESFFRLSATPTALDEETTSAPGSFQLLQNYPNPFNPETTIRFELLEGSNVELAVYDLTGQHVTSLVSGHKTSGAHQVIWNGRDAAGQQVSSGIYIYRMTVGNVVQARKMALIR